MKRDREIEWQKISNVGWHGAQCYSDPNGFLRENG